MEPTSNDQENNENLKVNSEGKKYEYEKNGTYYGGEYLPEPPEELNIEV